MPFVFLNVFLHSIYYMMRSAVGKTHDLRSDLWWTIPLRILLDQFWDTFVSQPIKSHGPLSRVHFGESLLVRLYSEIDHIHLSSEAQCVSHLYPQVDCHKLAQWTVGIMAQIYGCCFGSWLTCNFWIAVVLKETFYTIVKWKYTQVFWRWL